MASTHMPTPEAPKHKNSYHSKEVAGYRYGGEVVCPECIRDLFAPFYLAGDEDVSAEEILDAVAKRWEVDREKDTFSSYDFPHRILRPEVMPDDVCYVCGVHL
jgi:hypothetical protein